MYIKVLQIRARSFGTPRPQQPPPQLRPPPRPPPPPHIPNCHGITISNSALKIENLKFRENAKPIYCAAYWNNPLLVPLPSSLPTGLCCQLTITRRTKGDNLGAFRAVIVVPVCLSQLPSYSSCFFFINLSSFSYSPVPLLSVLVTFHLSPGCGERRRPHRLGMVWNLPTKQ